MTVRILTAIALMVLAACDASPALDAEAARQMAEAKATQNRLLAKGFSRYDYNDVRVIDVNPTRVGSDFVSCAMAVPTTRDGLPTGPERRAFVVSGAPIFDGPKQGPWFDHMWKKLGCANASR